MPPEDGDALANRCSGPPYIVDKITERIVTLTRKFLNCIPT